MPGVKESTLEMIKRLPDDITADDILEEIHFKMQVDAGLKELDEGRSISHEDVQRRMAPWTA